MKSTVAQMDSRAVKWIDAVCDRLGLGGLQGRRPLDPVNAMPFPFPDGMRVLFMPCGTHVTVFAEMKRSVPWHFEFDALLDDVRQAADVIHTKRLADSMV